MAKTVDLKKVKFNVPIEAPSATLPSIDDGNNELYTTEEKVQELIDEAFADIVRAEDTKF